MKAEITKVGLVLSDGTLSGFAFNGHGKVPGFSVDLETGEMLCAGYTYEELRAMAEGADREILD